MAFDSLLKTVVFLVVFGLLAVIYVPVGIASIRYSSLPEKAEIMWARDAQQLISRDAEIYRKMLSDRQIFVPMSEEFNIIIPILGANAAVHPETGFLYPGQYRMILRDAVAHAQWSAYPDKMGTMTLFSHLQDWPWNKSYYNQDFLGAYRLQTGDEIWIIYKGKQYTYRVTGKTQVKPEEVKFTVPQSEHKLLQLISPWPPGVSLRRLVITAEQVE